MRNVLATDIKNNIRSIRFILGIFLIVSATLMSEHEMLQKIINAGGSAEGPGWFVAYTYCMNSVNMLLFVPIAVAFAGGENTEAELHSRFFLFSYIRSGRKQYLVGKAAGLLVSGGLTAFLAMVFLLVICILRFGQYPSLIDGNYEMAVLVGRTAVSFLRLFLNGAFWALIGGTSAVITKNRYMSYAVPFILYYVLTVFQERYYQKAFFLSPRYWAASIYYNDIFCIAILAVGSFLTALIFMCAIERRLRYLFQGTIEENVNIDGKASRDAVVEACRKSGALGFIEKLDHGFGQKIGQDGAKLSGGERQKIAVARALLKNADILLMDEATEGFDVESNEALRELLHSELKNKTIVFITHKYKELESVDKVYRLSKGILELVRS